MSDTAIIPTRGERNNNPGNLDFVKSITWAGQLGIEPVPEGESYAPRFARFDAAQNGIRALCRQLLTDQRVHGCQTTREIVTRWAPGIENDTEAYIADVTCRFYELDPKATAKAVIDAHADMAVDLDEPPSAINFTVAMIHHENGRCLYDAATIARAVASALVA